MLATLAELTERMVTTEDVKEFVGTKNFDAMYSLFSPNTHYNLLNLVQELCRNHISHTIINRIIEGVRATKDAEENAELRKKIGELQDKNAKLRERINELEKADHAKAGKLDPRDEKSVYKICVGILKLCGKSLNPNTRNAIKRELDGMDLHISENTAKKHFDVIQEIMGKKPQ